MPKISVIVPVYNVEKYLRRCIDSILGQTFTDFELILVYDGSPDNCPAICDEYAKKDNRIRVIHQENQGQAAARNHAIAQANGEWVCFVDSDDMIHPQMLALLYVSVYDSHTQIGMCAAIEGEFLPNDFFKERKAEPIGQEVNEDFLSKLYDSGEHYCWVVWGKLIRTEIVRKIPFSSGRIYEDNAVVCQWLYEAKKVTCSQEKLYFYMVNSTGTTKSQFSIKKLDYLWALEEIIKFYKKVGYEKLRKKFCTEYMTTAVKYRWRMQDELHRQDIAVEIGKQMRIVYRKNLGFFNLSADYRIHAYDAMFPKLMRLYWLSKTGLTTLKRDGILEFAKKVAKHLDKGAKK